MGLRLSLDSSESESNGNPTSNTTTIATPSSSTYRQNRAGSDRPDIQRARNSDGPRSDGSGPDSGQHNRTPSETACNETPRTVDALLRELGEHSDDTSFLRLLYSYQARSAAQLAAGRLSGCRSNSVGEQHDSLTTGDSVVTESTAPTTTTSTTATSYTRSSNESTARERQQRHRSSWLGVSCEPTSSSGRTRMRRARRAETFGARVLPWESSDSDSEDDEYLNNLRLSSLMLRHFQLGNPSGRSRQLSVPQAEADLLRTLRLSTARISYNVDRLTQNKGECCICLEDLSEGDVIARLPCLCIYHKKCIDMWFKRRPVCPEHPGD